MTGVWYQVSVHEGYVLQAGLGSFLLRHQGTKQRLLLLHFSLQPLDFSVHSLQTVSQLRQLLLLELYDGLPGLRKETNNILSALRVKESL